MQVLFLRRRKTRKRKHKGTILTFERTNKQETQVFQKQKRETAQTATIQKTWLRVKKGKYVTGESKKGEKNDDETKQSLQTKKEVHKKGSDRGKNVQE